MFQSRSPKAPAGVGLLSRCVFKTTLSKQGLLSRRFDQIVEKDERQSGARSESWEICWRKTREAESSTVCTITNEKKLRKRDETRMRRNWELRQKWDDNERLEVVGTDSMLRCSRKPYLAEPCQNSFSYKHSILQLTVNRVWEKNWCWMVNCWTVDRKALYVYLTLCVKFGLNVKQPLGLSLNPKSENGIGLGSNHGLDFDFEPWVWPDLHKLCLFTPKPCDRFCRMRRNKLQPTNLVAEEEERSMW